MVVYIIIGLIVSAIEFIMAYRDMKNMGLSLNDIFPVIRPMSNSWIVFARIFSFIVLAFAWPVQVSHWIYRIYKRIFHKKV